MRQQISRKFIQHLNSRPDRLFQRIEISVLMKATAGALNVKGRHVLFAKDPLKIYAQFTKEAADQPDTDPQKLYEKMRKLGNALRRVTGFKDPEDLYELLFTLYRYIDIAMSGNVEEGFHFRQCYFSQFYSPHECHVISALDSGIASGLLGRGELVFTQRITEGCASCEACFNKEL